MVAAARSSPARSINHCLAPSGSPGATKPSTVAARRKPLATARPSGPAPHQPERDGGGSVPGVADPHHAGLDPADLPGVASSEDVPGLGLHRPVLHDGPDERVVRIGDHRVVAVSGMAPPDVAAARRRPLRGSQQAVDLCRGAGRRPADPGRSGCRRLPARRPRRTARGSDRRKERPGAPGRTGRTVVHSSAATSATICWAAMSRGRRAGTMASSRPPRTAPAERCTRPAHPRSGKSRPLGVPARL